MSEPIVWLQDCRARLFSKRQELPNQVSLLNDKDYPELIQVCEKIVQSRMTQAKSAVTTMSQPCAKR